MKAVDYGFKKVEDPSAYGGCYFIKNGLKWIFDIAALMSRLGYNTEEQLVQRGYDVKTYYHVNPVKSLRTTPSYDNSNNDIYQDIHGDNSDMYLCDGMWVTSSGVIYED